MKTNEIKNQAEKYVVHAFEELLATARYINQVNCKVCLRNETLRQATLECVDNSLENFELAMRIAHGYYRMYATRKRQNKKFTNKRFIR